MEYFQDHKLQNRFFAVREIHFVDSLASDLRLIQTWYADYWNLVLIMKSSQNKSIPWSFIFSLY